MPQTAVETLTMRGRYFVASCWCSISGIANGLPVPPPRLTWLVADHFMVVRSLRNGIRSAEQIRETLARHRLRIDDFPEVLDFGCGSGRVLRNWRTLTTTRVYGTDYNSEMIRWCRTHLRFAHFATNELHPPLAWDDGTFAFIYALSVFTHLDVPLQKAWIAELRRALKRGGYLLITTHGEYCVSRLDEGQQAAFRAGEIVVHRGEKSGTNQCSVFHPPAWVTTHLLHGFVLLDHIPAGATATGMQDIYLLQKTDVSNARS
jgi:SAM-dependent methyltransferase